MSDMPIEDYLAAGGRLTSPLNVPPRYRAELLKLMATFVDSELAGAAGFADIINDGPGIKERIAAAKIVLEKTDHADRVLRLMGEFGADTARYATHHPWAARLARTADIGTTRSAHDMRLAVFNYPLDGWTDAVVMNLLMGLAVQVQLEDMAQVSYQPLAETLRDIAPRETRHAEMAQEGVSRILADKDGQTKVKAALDYWWPRVAASFGVGDPLRHKALVAQGLRRRDGVEMRADWVARAGTELDALGLSRP